MTEDEGISLSIEDVLAVVIDRYSGRIEIPREMFYQERSGDVIAIDYIQDTQTVVLSLTKAEEIKYDDTE